MAVLLVVWALTMAGGAAEQLVETVQRLLVVALGLLT
jgi:hypothetical protein